MPRTMTVEQVVKDTQVAMNRGTRRVIRNKATALKFIKTLGIPLTLPIAKTRPQTRAQIKSASK